MLLVEVSFGNVRKGGILAGVACPVSFCAERSVLQLGGGFFVIQNSRLARGNLGLKRGQLSGRFMLGRGSRCLLIIKYLIGLSCLADRLKFLELSVW